MLEEKNTDYMQINMELEENVKKTGNWRPQIDAYKKQGSLSFFASMSLFENSSGKSLLFFVRVGLNDATGGQDLEAGHPVGYSFKFSQLQTVTRVRH